MTRRADQVDETRRRIVGATVHLHEQLGLTGTTIAAVAEAAGVTRLTVYRHFPSEGDLISACSADWIARQTMPDPAVWATVRLPDERLRVGLSDLYRHYAEGESMLRHVFAELDALPEPVREQVEAAERRYRDVLVAGFRGPERRPLLAAAVGHAVSFWTWRSLCRDEGLPNSDAVGLMTSLVLAARTGRRPRS